MGKPSHRSHLCGPVMIPTLVFFLSLLDLHFFALAEFVPASEALSDYTNATLTPGIFGRQLDSGSDDHSCSKDRECLNGACCGASGWCGYGEVYCGDGCTSNCDATAECGKDSASGTATCPLNVCCSQFGFCGTTPDFCENGCQSNCGTPNDPGGGGDARDRVVGYYESWRAHLDSCGVMTPAQIPVDELDILNFAFAYIDTDLNIVPMANDASLDDPWEIFHQVTNVKFRNPKLQVWLSIGGWDFFDDGTDTQPIFGNIAGSADLRSEFANRLMRFMSQYGFDGVDLDWPFVTSLTAPATAPSSYWYLRWFDLPGLAQHSNFINLMSYDLHGTWDQNNEIGNNMYAHTNLTEVELALQLFWRVGIDPALINLGIGFYGRSYTVADPACNIIGCEFQTGDLLSSGGAAGPCTKTKGILSYKEINDIIADNEDSALVRYDETAAVKMLIYGQGLNWVSYDDKTTYQQRVEFANARGLGGLMIWAIDQDDERYTALESLLGKDIDPGVDLSPTEDSDQFDLSLCMYTKCGDVCPDGTKQMTWIDQDGDGNSCRGIERFFGYYQPQRRFCCPPWGAPDPTTCHWSDGCYCQCDVGEITMALDDEGDQNGNICIFGKRAYCCPSDSAPTAPQCKQISSWGGKCTSDLPQKVGAISGVFVDIPVCCSADVKYDNCKWYGKASPFSCTNSQCPVGKVEVYTSKMDDEADWCWFGTTHSLCCNPGEGYGSGILPVELDRLFPESDEFTGDDVPNFSEAFYQDKAVLPQPLYSGDTNDPNTSPFAWVIIVGCEDDVQSLDKRHGSHLDVFDCPDTHADDFSVQSLRAVCTEESPDNNCQDILLGGAENTVLRLPPECSPDVYVRVVSFSRLENATAPAHLTKRLVNDPKVYEIRYDYDFSKVREKKERQQRGLSAHADGCGDIYFRVDSSDQQNYWHEIVQSSPQGKVKKRSPQDWRQFHLDWFEQHGFMNNTAREDRVGKRGYGDDGWWKNLFNKLANQQLTQPYEGSTRYGIYRYYPFSQMLYNARRSCPPNADASIEAKVEGSFEANLGFGLSLVGTLTNFNLDDAYAYFVLDDANAFTKVSITGQAGFTISSGSIPLLENFAPWGGSFNIKGIATVGPFLDITAQLQSLATLSGSLVGEVLIATDEAQVFMYPTSLGVEPDPKYFSIYNIKEATKVSAGVEANVAAEGHVVVKLDQSAAFKIQVHFLSSDLVNTDIRATYSNSMDLGIGAGASSGSDKCSGIWYWMNWASSVTLKMLSPLPNWAGGNLNNKLFSTQVEVIPKKCYSWSESKDKRELLQLSPDYYTDKAIFNTTVIDALLVRRADVDDQNPLFPDPGASCLRCATDTNTPLGKCGTTVYGDDGSEPLDCLDSSTSAKRKLEGVVERGLIEKRSSKSAYAVCKGSLSITVNGISFPDSGQLVADGFRQQSNPDPGDVDTSLYGTEHVLEWQTLQFFLQSLGNNNDPTASYANCASDTFKQANLRAPWDFIRDAQIWSTCQHLKFWWVVKAISVPWYTSANVQFTPMSIMGQAIPNNENSFDEFQLLDRDVNSAKQAAWSSRAVGHIRNYESCIKSERWAEAMNKIRLVIWTLKYSKATQDVFKAQATRIGSWLDKTENALATVKDTSWAKCQYKKLDLGNKWRKYIYSRTNTVISRFTNNIQDGIRDIQKALNIDDEGDTDMGGTTTGASEQNKDLLDRLDKIKALWDSVGPWTNPLPADWE
ncbi:glycoside hydrolase family 18 protein [Trichoderma ceciliae]